MTRAFVLKARAKINLGLKVIGRRPDGYHDLETVMQEVSLADKLLFEPCPGSGWIFSCTEYSLAGPDNLVSRAAALLEKKAGKCPGGVRITLFKNIPTQAGLAGGSSDAAAALKGLNRFWRLGLSEKELFCLGVQLGSDVPFFFLGGTALAGGRGEQLVSLPPLPFYWVVLALPPAAAISTAEAYRALNLKHMGTPSIDSLVRAIKMKGKKEIEDWMKSGRTNTFETTAVPALSRALDLKEKLKKRGLFPALSGSGPALFMLADNFNLARSALKAVEGEGGRAYLTWTTPTTGERCHV